MIMKTRPEAASTIHTCSLLHVKLSCHVLARLASIHLFLRTGRTERVKFANMPEHKAMSVCRERVCKTPFIFTFWH